MSFTKTRPIGAQEKSAKHSAHTNSGPMLRPSPISTFSVVGFSVTLKTQARFRFQLHLRDEGMVTAAHLALAAAEPGAGGELLTCVNLIHRKIAHFSNLSDPNLLGSFFGASQFGFYVNLAPVYLLGLSSPGVFRFGIRAKKPIR